MIIKVTEDMKGKFVRVYFSDTGCVDCICTGVELDSKGNSFSIFIPAFNSTDGPLPESQLVAIGPSAKIEIPRF